MNISELYQIYLKHPFVSTDTRSITPDSIFFALKGENFDAHQFVKQALELGVAFCVIDDSKAYIDNRTILVHSVLETLQQLANYHRQQLSIPIIAITGTNGKTTTKELIYGVLKEQFQVTCTKGNLNNHIGVPLTLLSIAFDSDIAIVEMGANHPKEIATLCKIANPNFGIITNIGRAHLEGFGSFEGIIKTKTELYHHLKDNIGRVFVNGDDDLLMNLSKGLDRIVYGTSSPFDFHGNLIEMNPFLKISFQNINTRYSAQTNLVGNYNLYNILAATAVGLYFKVNPNNIVNALEKYHPDNMRSQIKKTAHNQLIIDTYNANPTSMNAALDNFNTIKGDKVLILGDMLELGKWSEEEHVNILKKIENLNIKKVFLVGKQFMAIVPQHFSTFENVNSLMNFLKDNPITDSLILIKGSRGIKLEQIIPFL